MNTHWSAGLVLGVNMMEELKLSLEEIGVKRKSGILKNQQTMANPYRWTLEGKPLIT